MAGIWPVRSIRFKIGLVFAGTFFLGFSLAAAYVYVQVKDVLIRQENRILTERAIRLSERTSLYPLVIPLPEQGEVIALWYTAGRFRKKIYQSPNFPDDYPIRSDSVVTQSDTFQLVRYERTPENGYGRLTTVLGHSNRPLVRQLQSIGWLLTGILLLSVLFSGLGAWVFSGLLLRPLKAIIDSARSVNLAEEVTPIPTPDSDDELQELARTINDMLARIRSAADTQHNFFAAASHELRTPLSILRTEIEVAQREVTNERERRFLTSQLTELRRLSRLVDDLLAMSQLHAGTLQLRKEAIELDDLTLRLAERYHGSINQKQLFLAIALDDDAASLTVWADLDKLTNVLLNLLDNAVKYARAGSQLELRIMAGNGSITWRLVNHTDIPVPDPGRLTGSFYQADSRHDGYGLGLWISNQVLRLMGGEFTVSAVSGSFQAEISFPAHITE